MSTVDKRNPLTGAAGIRYHKVYGADEVSLALPEPPTEEFDVPVSWYEPAEEETWETSVSLKFPSRDGSPSIETSQGASERITADEAEYEDTGLAADWEGMEAFAKNHVRVIADSPQEAAEEFEKMWLNGKHVVADGRIWKRVPPRAIETGTPVEFEFDWRGNDGKRGGQITGHIPAHDRVPIYEDGASKWTVIDGVTYAPTGEEPTAEGIQATIKAQARQRDAGLYEPDTSVSAENEAEALTKIRKRWLDGRLITVGDELWAQVDRI
jgi:hypothetical protein